MTMNLSWFAGRIPPSGMDRIHGPGLSRMRTYKDISPLLCGAKPWHYITPNMTFADATIIV